MEADLNVSFQSIVRKSLGKSGIWHQRDVCHFKRNDVLITRSKLNARMEENRCIFMSCQL